MNVKLLESLAEARMDAAYLERKAREAKDKVLAEQLAAKGQELKARIGELRGASHDEWRRRAKDLAPRFKTARGKLKDVLKKAEKDQAWAQNAAKALDALDDLLALAKKVAG